MASRMFRDALLRRADDASQSGTAVVEARGLGAHLTRGATLASLFCRPGFPPGLHSIGQTSLRSFGDHRDAAHASRALLSLMDCARADARRLASE